MIIGTVKPEESQAYDSHKGYHSFHAEESQEKYGSFEIYFLPKSGWYWHACFAGCLPDGEPSGPFAYSQQAHQDANEWSPEYDDD